MVMQAGNLALNPEFEKVRAELQAARENYTLLVEEYSNLTGVVSQYLQSEYMLKIGKKEHKLFSCQVEILRLKREISLFQAARNRNETITSEEVKKIIRKEFAEYQEQLEKQKEELERARLYFGAKKLTQKEVKSLKKLYHDLVRKLHPDINPGLPDEAVALWMRIKFAYQINDWQELTLLAEMVDELLDGKNAAAITASSLVLLQEELEKITRKTAELKERIEKTKKQVPFVYEELLSDPAAVKAKRRELDSQIKLCEARIVELQELRQEFGA